MGIFNKFRSDGTTYDGQGEERRGLIDVVQYNGDNDDLLWRFPYDNLSTHTQLVVQEGQEAVFLSSGRIADIFGPGNYTLSTNNIPVLQKLVNLPFGGRSPFKATVTYVNTTTRVAKWGTNGLIPVTDYSLGDEGMVIKVGAFGNCSVKVIDSAMFIREFAGTLHNITGSDFMSQFKEKISQQIKPEIAKFFEMNRLKITQVTMFLNDLSMFMQNAMNTYFERFGLKITDFAVAAINPDENDANYKSIREAQADAAKMDTVSRAEARRYARFGTSYQQERQLDVMQTAAGNEGSPGTVMGAGMGFGMGFGMTGAMGTQMGQLANVMNADTIAPQLPPTVTYYVLVNNQQQGPFTIPQLMQLVQQGVLTPISMVWKQGMPGWAAAQTCQDLINLFNPGVATPPPPPPPTA